MTKTISQKLREHALGDYGGSQFQWVPCHEVYRALMQHKVGDEESMNFEPDERRMYALFVAEKLESEQ
jgi:hypothetical protein